MPHIFRCLKCGESYLDPADVFTPNDGGKVKCHHHVEGICDARHCRTVAQLCDAMNEIEEWDTLVKVVILSGRNFTESLRGEADIDQAGVLLFGARVQFDNSVTVWDEELCP